MTPSDARALLAFLTPAEREELDALVLDDLDNAAWVPLPPQELTAANKHELVAILDKFFIRILLQFK